MVRATVAASAAVKSDKQILLFLGLFLYFENYFDALFCLRAQDAILRNLASAQLPRYAAVPSGKGSPVCYFAGCQPADPHSSLLHFISRCCFCYGK